MSRNKVIDVDFSRFSMIFVLIGCIVLTFALYAPILHYYFVAEDLNFITFGWHDVLLEFNDIGESTGFRPGTQFYLFLNNSLWGRQPAAYRAVFLLLHALVGFFTYQVTVGVTKNRIAAVLAATIFLASPVHIEPVVWIAASVGTLTTGAVCMFAAWIWISEKNEDNWWIPGIVGLLYFIALLIKEVAIPLPGILLLLDLAKNRIPYKKGAKAIFKSLLRYLPFVIALGLYVILYLRVGVLDHAISYGVHLNLGLSQQFTIWGMYAKNLFQPFSGFFEPVIGGNNWIWLGLFIGLFIAVKSTRWAFLWVMVALLPTLTAYADRLTYLALVGFSIGISIFLSELLFRFVAWFKPKNLQAAQVIGLIIVVFMIVAANFYVVRKGIVPWEYAGKLTWSIPRQAKELLPNPPSGSELFFINLPERINGAYIFSWGITPEVRYVYNDESLIIQHVIDGPPRGGKILLSEIECESEVPRYFFRFNEKSEKVKLLNIEDVGLACEFPITGQ